MALGLARVAVIVRPAATGLNSGQLVALAAAVVFAVSVVLVKSLIRTDTATQVSFWTLVEQSAIGLVPALLIWQGPSAAASGFNFDRSPTAIAEHLNHESTDCYGHFADRQQALHRPTQTNFAIRLTEPFESERPPDGCNLHEPAFKAPQP